MPNKKINWGEELKTAGKVGLSGVGKFFQIFANILMTILLIVALTGIIVVCAFSVYINNYVETEIDAEQFRIDVSSSTTTHMYRMEFADRANRVGEAVPMDSAADRQLQGEVDQMYVPIDKIPDNMINAVIAIEDKRFMTHSGVDWKRTAGAGLTFFTGGGDGFGGSSITQQLIKNVTGNDEYSIQRKIQEIFWALDLETKMDKEEIIELYLNIVNFGNGSNGVQAAAYNYFSKDVSELTLIECAAIACITKNPSRFNPIIYPEYNAERRNIVLYEMYDQGLITYREFEEAYQKELVLNVPGASDDENEEESDLSGVNSWYADMVIEDVIADLMEKYNYSEKMAAILVYNGGLNIYTLVDPEIQTILEEAFTDESNFPVDKSGIKAQCSAIVIDPYTGDVLGVVGARGEKTANRIQNFATFTKRPPGSAIKPLAVYAPAFEKGLLTWSTVLEDTPHSYQGNKGWPKNSTNNYRGLINVAYALKVSTNTVAVKMLEKVGLKNAFDFCYDTLNMKSMIEYGEFSDGTGYSDVGLAALALGQLNYGVTVREITAAYSMFVNSGIYSEPNSYLKVTDSSGNVLLENGYEGTVAISEETASIMNMLLESVPRTGGTAASIQFDSKYDIDVAGKTGSAGDYFDRWFIGYTPYYICGVWYGYEYPKHIDDISTNPCVKVWDAVMGKVHEDKVIANMQEGDKYLEFNVSNNLVQATFCKDSGLLMSEACSHDPRGNRAETGWFVKGTEPKEYCETHVMVDYDYVEKAIACEWCPPENIKQVALIKVDRKFPIQVAVVDAQYAYIELPFDVMPFSTVYRPYYYNLGGKEYYVGYTSGPVHYNRTCSAHFNKTEWQKKVAEIIAGMETTAPNTEVTDVPSDMRRRFFDLFTLPKFDME